MTEIVLASRNKKKIAELQSLLDESLAGKVKILSLSDIGFDGEIDEFGDSFEVNSLIKAAVPARLGYIGVADDSGLCVDALGGAPGIYSARFLGEDTPYTEKNAIVLNRLKDVPDEQRTARYVCAICCIFPNEDIISTEGVCEGKMGYEPKGSNGFGYDPIFVYGDKSLAEISDEEKDKISHRGIALKKFVVELKKYLDKQ